MAKDTGIVGAADRRGIILPDVPGCGERLLEIEDRADRPADDWSAWWQSFLRGAPLPDASAARPLRVVDLFCGSGGFGLGVSLAARGVGRRAWFERIVDTDAGALNVHARSLDVGRTVNAGVSSLVDYQIRRRQGCSRFAYDPEIIDPALDLVPDVDLLIAGPPCQGHSNLNNHTRRRDPRNDLFICTVAVAIALRAKAVLIENVRTVTASHGDVVGLARELFEGSGYTVDQDIVRADRLGWPQTRERYFMTALREDAAASPLPEIRERDPQDVMWAIADLIDLEVATEPFDTAPVPSPENRKRIDWLFKHDSHELDNSERPECHRDGTTYTAVYGRMYADRPAPTITTGIGTPGQGRFIHPSQPRLVTPHEAARIQGFPDGYGFLEDGRAAKRKDLAKWIGDAVPAPMGYEMARRVFAALALVLDAGAYS